LRPDLRWSKWAEVVSKEILTRYEFQLRLDARACMDLDVRGAGLARKTISACKDPVLARMYIENSPAELKFWRKSRSIP